MLALGADPNVEAQMSSLPLGEFVYFGSLMKTIAIAAKVGVLSLIVLTCFFVGYIGHDALDAVSSGKNVVIESSDGAVVKITNVRRGAIEFISGTGGVTAFSPGLIGVAGLLFVVISSLAMFGSFCLLRGNGQRILTTMVLRK